MQQFTSIQHIYDWLNRFEHPLLIAEWASSRGLVKQTDPGNVDITLPFASNELLSALSDWLIKQQEGDAPFTTFTLNQQVKPLQSKLEAPVKGVKNIIAVTSAKGGVGKSTTAINLALAISKSGAKVGVLDADVYGPSVPLMLGTEQAQPEVRDGKWMQPIQAHGLYTHSIGYLVSKSEAAIWRGPMASRALGQLLNETDWPDLDYLVIDMPPGTGDIQLTLSQQIPVTGAIIVTTPQDLALADAKKGAAMFNKVDVPVVGLVENMSYHICGSCGAKEHIFGVGGAEAMAGEYGLSLLAQIPLHIEMRKDIDSGKPTVAARPESEHTQFYVNLADRVCSNLYWQGKEKPETILFTRLD